MKPIEHFINRPKRYVNVDGLGELSFGLILLAFPFWWWGLAALAPKDSGWQGVLLLLPLLLVGWIPRGIEALRKRVTYARTGFVLARQEPMPLRILLVVGLLLLLLYLPVVLPPLRHLNPSALMGICGTGLAAAYAYEIARGVRWKCIVVLVLAIGSLGVSLVGWGLYTWRWIGLLFVFFGLAWVISGGITFWLYLRRTQPLAEDAG